MATPAAAIQYALQLCDFSYKLNQLCDAQAIILSVLLATNSVTNISPPSASIMFDSHQASPGRPKLRCIRFLKKHYEQQGVDKQGHDMVYRMIEMMSAIGWEVHVTFQSKIVRPGSLVNMELYADCILQGCEVFRKNMRSAFDRAAGAMETLPKLDGPGGQDQETKLMQWRWKFR